MNKGVKKRECQAECDVVVNPEDSNRFHSQSRTTTLRLRLEDENLKPEP
jgi:hypothetical protein